MLRESRPTALEGALLTVTIPSNLALMRAREPGNAELLAAAAEGALGVPFEAAFVPAEASASGPAQAEPTPTPQDFDFTEQIRHAQEILGAERLPDEP